MKCYVGQICCFDIVERIPFHSHMLGAIIGSTLFFYREGQIIVRSSHAPSKGSYLSIELDDEGKPTSGQWAEEDEAMDIFLQLVKDLKQDEKVNK